MFPAIPYRLFLNSRWGYFIFIFVWAYNTLILQAIVYPLISYYNRNGARCSIGVGFPFRALVPDTDVSEAPEGFLDNFEDGGSGVLDPLDGVRILKQMYTYISEPIAKRYLSTSIKCTPIFAFFFRHIFSERMKERSENFWNNINVYLVCLMAVGMLVAEFVHRELLLALWKKKKTLVDKLKYKML